jgi:3-hydroxybutyryl-CoA dehydrogenase
MTPINLTHAPVLVVGAGIMGAGIAQVAAQAGHAVMLFDTREGAAAEAKLKLSATLDVLVDKAKLTPEAAAMTMGRITAIDALEHAVGARLVVEAIVEKLDIKRSLFKQLEVADGCRVCAGHQHLVHFGHRHCQRSAPPRAAGGHAFFQPCAADEAGRGGVGLANVASGGAGHF